MFVAYHKILQDLRWEAPGSLSLGPSGLTLLFLEPQGTPCYGVRKRPSTTSRTCQLHSFVEPWVLWWWWVGCQWCIGMPGTG